MDATCGTGALSMLQNPEGNVVKDMNVSLGTNTINLVKSHLKQMQD